MWNLPIPTLEENNFLNFHFQLWCNKSYSPQEAIIEILR